MNREIDKPLLIPPPPSTEMTSLPPDDIHDAYNYKPLHEDKEPLLGYATSPAKKPQPQQQQQQPLYTTVTATLHDEPSVVQLTKQYEQGDYSAAVFTIALVMEILSVIRCFPPTLGFGYMLALVAMVLNLICFCTYRTSYNHQSRNFAKASMVMLIVDGIITIIHLGLLFGAALLILLLYLIFFVWVASNAQPNPNPPPTPTPV